MGTYIVKRLLLFIPTVLGITVITFLLLHLIPGDPGMVILGQNASPAAVKHLDALLGLNKPLYVQLWIYIQNLLHGNLGNSIYQNEPVISLIRQDLPATIELAVVAMIIALIIAVPLGILSAVKQFSWLDYCSMALAQVGVSMPVFWLGMLLILAFSVHLGWLPSFGDGPPLLQAIGTAISTGDVYDLLSSLSHILMPAFSLGVMGAALITRMIRSAMLEVLKEDYIRTAEAKGVRGFVVVVKHALRNALLPIITVVGLQFGTLLGGAIATETVFAWPGVGQLTVTAISQRDYPVVQGCVLIIALLFSAVNLLVDILYAVINPKIRQGGA
ncbi:ABC transporter permease [Alicyclobacillus cycloheptanicus]|uniref:Peptide/nickel transport system permease protein n=1 Tax=Alicyclobacillus cycloheptanicus TaxID=1457 RepID=A0ABT9XFG2_9BACL|nr:ABC transporter permease [Alicyclobacillus cycloheptanicus]MDQ0189044.1 peptide/nickel transport system permease protein [Alicyclobacillus cycloheptanicus]WDM00181.1 ABC transporter permease [Alicyclobacillus cycloheptanicus]